MRIGPSPVPLSLSFPQHRLVTRHQLPLRHRRKGNSSRSEGEEGKGKPGRTTGLAGRTELQGEYAKGDDNSQKDGMVMIITST